MSRVQFSPPQKKYLKERMLNAAANEMRKVLDTAKPEGYYFCECGMCAFKGEKPRGALVFCDGRFGKCNKRTGYEKPVERNKKDV